MRILKYDIEKVTGIPWKKKKSYRYLYRLACREDVIKKAFKRMRKGKTKRKDFQMAEENLDAWVKKIQEIILQTYGHRVSAEEISYLSVHIRRIRFSGSEDKI